MKQIFQMDLPSSKSLGASAAVLIWGNSPTLKHNALFPGRQGVVTIASFCL